jgi:hypothetical protein
VTTGNAFVNCGFLTKFPVASPIGLIDFLRFFLCCYLGYALNTQPKDSNAGYGDAKKGEYLKMRNRCDISPAEPGNQQQGIENAVDKFHNLNSPAIEDIMYETRKKYGHVLENFLAVLRISVLTAGGEGYRGNGSEWIMKGHPVNVLIRRRLHILDPVIG